jgi:hypothetical protein
MHVARSSSPGQGTRLLESAGGRSNNTSSGAMTWTDHYEGRSWRGFHHHLTMSSVAYLFVVVDYLRAKKNFCPDVGTGVAADTTVARAFNRLLSLLSDGILGFFACSYLTE